MLKENEYLTSDTYAPNNPTTKYDLFGLYTLDDAENSLKKKGVAKANIGIFWDSYSDTQIFDEWIVLERSSGTWWTSLPKCPKEICVGKNGKAICPNKKVWSDPNVGVVGGAVLGVFHPGAKYELRTLAGVSGSPHGNQCTYNESGDLITTIPAAGSADYYGPNNNFGAHQGHDVETYKLANKLTRVADYYSFRPVW